MLNHPLHFCQVLVLLTLNMPARLRLIIYERVHFSAGISFIWLQKLYLFIYAEISVPEYFRTVKLFGFVNLFQAI